jgi:hypothetical protein
VTPEQALVARLWERYAGVAADRVTVLERAAEALADGTATDQQRLEARSAAHKLSGALGTYGRPGSEVARQVEELISGGRDLRDVPALVAVLRRCVDAAPPAVA